jgi:TorA maturation chaperone TorD
LTTTESSFKVIALAPEDAAPAAEDQARADFYALIAHLLLRPPAAGLLADLAAAGELAAGRADHPLAVAWTRLAGAARATGEQAVREEHAALFISIGNPLINPYASFYLSGFMMEKPLAALRRDLAALSLSRVAGVGEPEDHLGALCEVMRLLIAGAPGLAPRTLDEQRSFFLHHLAPWYRRCLDDVRAAAGANFYRELADFIQVFFDVEYQAFDMLDAGEASHEAA